MRNYVAVATFKTKLIQLIAILEPIARAVKCLESTLTTAADVYRFWLAILATLDGLFRGTGEYDVQYPIDLTDAIRRLVNARWKQCTDGLERQVYLATLFLDPRMYTWLPYLNALGTIVIPLYLNPYP